MVDTASRATTLARPREADARGLTLLFIRVFDQNPFPGTPSAEPTEIDTETTTCANEPHCG